MYEGERGGETVLVTARWGGRRKESEQVVRGDGGDGMRKNRNKNPDPNPNSSPKTLFLKSPPRPLASSLPEMVERVDINIRSTRIGVSVPIEPGVTLIHISSFFPPFSRTIKGR